MPLAKIHVVEGRYDEDRIAKVSGAVQAALKKAISRSAISGYFRQSTNARVSSAAVGNIFYALKR
jgi:hypothetical protein